MAQQLLVCPKCGGPVVPMKGKASGKGWNCRKHKYAGGSGACDGAIWNKAAKGAFFSKPEQTARATSFPVIAKPTTEQLALRKHLATSPKARGGRCTIGNAGPGTAKTTSTAWSMEAVYERLGSLLNYGMRAFNVNAANVLLGKLPAVVGDIATLHSAGKAAQGARGLANTGKISKAYYSLVSHLDPKDRPGMGRLKAVLERCRCLCLWTTPDDLSGWGGIIACVLARFPSLAKKCVGQEKHIATYLPTLADITLADGRTVDFSDMISRPVLLAMKRTGWRMPTDLPLKPAQDWEDKDVAHFAALIRTIDLPDMAGLVVDEAQDLSLDQIAVVLAQTWRRGELTLIGDDRAGNPGEDGFKAGQAIYGWRGAFSGSLTLIARLWKELTGEEPQRKDLTVTFRHGPEMCAAYRPLNTVIKSALPEGYSAAYAVGPHQAFSAWLNLPETLKDLSGKEVTATALWITRTNAALAPVFLDTLRNHADCTIRGGADFANAVTDALYEAAGAPDDNGEFGVSLPDAITALRRVVAEMSEEGGEVDPNCLEAFMLEMGEALTQTPELLSKANLPKVLTVGNLRRFVLFFADKKSRRVLTTVYRCKGDEADLTVVADVLKFNESWGDPHEDAACRHVALSRGKRLMLTIGGVLGSMVRRPEEGVDLLEPFQTA